MTATLLTQNVRVSVPATPMRNSKMSTRKWNWECALLQLTLVSVSCQLPQQADGLTTLHLPLKFLIIAPKQKTQYFLSQSIYINQVYFLSRLQCVHIQNIPIFLYIK